MINSMTGFARSEGKVPQGQLQWELRSVNHRYLDVHLKVPDGFRAIEPELRGIITSSLGRGKVDAVLNLNLDSHREGTTRLNLPLAQQLIGHLLMLSPHA